MFMRDRLLLCVLLGFSLPAPAEEEVDLSALSLRAAMELAATNNLDVALARASARGATGMKLVERADILPEFGANVSQTRQERSTDAFGLPESSTATVGDPVPFDIDYGNVSQDIIREFNLPSQGTLTIDDPIDVDLEYAESTRAYSFFNAKLKLDLPLLDMEQYREFKAAEANETRGSLVMRAAQESAMTEAALLYLAVLANREAVTGAEARVRLQDGRLKMQKDRLATGRATDIDVRQQELYVSTSLNTLKELQRKLAASERELRRTLRLPENAPLTLTDTLFYAPLPTPVADDAVGSALHQRADYLTQLQAETVAVHRVEAARNAYWPTVKAMGDYGQQGYYMDDTVEAWFVGAVVEIPIWDSYRRSGKLIQRESELAQTRFKTEDLQDTISVSVRGVLDELDVKASSVQLATEAVSLQESKRSLAQDKADSGQATPLELLQAEVDLEEARYRKMQALYEYDVALVAWFASLGDVADFCDFAKGSRDPGPDANLEEANDRVE